MKLNVLRGTPGEAERWQEYDVEAGADTTVLDALVEIQRAQDATLALRYACRVGMCGSCAMVIDGRERWACRTRLADLTARGARVTVRPLYHFPLLRDLVVDMAPFVARMARVGAALVPAAGAGTYALIPAGSRERREIDEAIECIGCGMCVSACTMVAAHGEFPGPAALNRAFTLQRDSRDTAHETRWDVLLSEAALTRCHGQGNCTEVCPMGLSPAQSIGKLRREGTGRLVKRLLRLASVALLLALPGTAAAQRVTPYLPLAGAMPPAFQAAPWALSAVPRYDTRRATIVASLPAPQRYRVCNESNTTALVLTDVQPQGFDLPGRTCVDVAAKTITVSQRVVGTAPFGSYARLD